MELNIKHDYSKKEVFNLVNSYLLSEGFNIIDSDETRPWGGFYVIDEKQSERFIDLFLDEVIEAKANTVGKISPKILIVDKNKRLSWQYHHRRSEVWKVINGTVGVVISDNDEEQPMQVKYVDDVIILKEGQRHRLVGLDEWGIIAEIWQHTIPGNPSDEEDIVRVKDDFGR